MSYTKLLLIRLHIVEGIDPHYIASQIMVIICLCSVAVFDHLQEQMMTVLNSLLAVLSIAHQSITSKLSTLTGTETDICEFSVTSFIVQFDHLRLNCFN